MKINIDLGEVVLSSGKNLSQENQILQLDLEELLATRLLVQGNSGSGKSHLLRRILEQSAQWVQQCVIDPEGDFVTLSEKFGHLVLDAAQCGEKDIIQIAERIRQRRVSVILNLENLDVNQQVRAAALFLNGLFEVDRAHWYPLLVVVDEAQLFAPAVGGDLSDDIRKTSLSAMTNLMCRGRKRGLAGVIATQRLAKLAKNVAAEASNFLMGRTFLDIDMVRAADLLGMERRQTEMFRELARGHFVALGPALSRRPIAVRIGGVETLPKSVNPVLLPLPPSDQGDHAWVVAVEPVEGVGSPMPEKSEIFIKAEDLLQAIEQGDFQQNQQQVGNGLEEEEEKLLEAESDRTEIYQKILYEMAEDKQISFQSTAALYQDFIVRCRISRLKGDFLDLSSFRQQLVIARACAFCHSEAPISNDIDQEKWKKMINFSQNLVEEVQTVFLTLARVALMAQACPDDHMIAQIYGTYSVARVRRLLHWFEEQNIFVIRTDFSGRRAFVFPDFMCETNYAFAEDA